ncbi:MAG: DHA2 family efflux MFS transporter permease subunit [Thermomicrobiales bacterium]
MAQAAVQPARPVAAKQQQKQQEQNPWLILIVVCTAVFMLLLDTTIVNNAQVKIKESLGANLNQIQWVLDSYILTYAVLLLSFGRLGDVYGRKKLFILGMSIFTIASGLCATSAWVGDTLNIAGINFLIASRVLQGFGGALMMPQTLSLLTVAFPPEKRGAAFGVWGSVTALGAVIGPVIGGLIVTNFAWEWVFLINLPVGALSILAAFKIIPESKDPLASNRIDWGGLVLSGTAIFSLVYASIEGNKKGWTSPLILGMYLLAAVLIAVFIWWERRSADPMMKLELFKIRNFSIGTTISLIVTFGMLGIFFPMTIFLQQVLGFSPIRAGLTMTPMSVMIMVSAPFAGRFTDKIGARWIMVTGLLFMAGGILFIVSRIDLDTTWKTLFPALVVTGFGMGMTFSPMTAASMGEVPPRIAGSASGVLNTARNLGQVLGIAVLGSVLQNRLGVNVADQLQTTTIPADLQAQVVEVAKQSQFELLPSFVPTGLMDTVWSNVQIAFVDSLHSTFFVGAVACFIAAGLGVLIRNPAPRVATASAPNEKPAVVAAD